MIEHPQARPDSLHAPFTATGGAGLSYAPVAADRQQASVCQMP